MGISYLSLCKWDDLINDGADSLKRLRDKIVQESDEKAPSFLLVLTAVGAVYNAFMYSVIESYRHNDSEL